MRPIVTDGVAWSVCGSVLSVTIVSHAETAEPIEMQFGLWTCVGPRKHYLMGMHIGATWPIRLNRPRAAVMRPHVIL